MIKKNCRLCKSKNLKMFLDLGHHPPSDQFIKEKTRPNSLAAEPLVAWCQQFLPF